MTHPWWLDVNPVDDDWDWDTEIGLREPEYQPVDLRELLARTQGGGPLSEPEREPPRLQVCVLTAGSVGEFLRAARAHAGLSQRALAATSSVPRSTVGGLEAGRIEDVGLVTLTRLATACGVELVGRCAQPESELPASAEPKSDDPKSDGLKSDDPKSDDALLLHTDLAQRHRDVLGRMLPAHLVNVPVHDPEGRRGWWGFDRPALLRERSVPARTYATRVYSAELLRALGCGPDEVCAQAAPSVLPAPAAATSSSW